MADDTDDALKKHRDLLIACGWGKEVDVILLLQQGASVRVQDQDGKNCLHYAACKGHIQVTNLLIENECAINAKDKSNRTPLHLAAEEGHKDIVSILLDHKVEFDVQDEEGFTPCHVACLNDHSEVLELLIQIKADLTIKSKEGLTPLHLAAIHGNMKSMSLLIQAGVSLSPQDTLGNTPLHYAIQAKSSKSLKCLIKNGANVNVQNHDGDSPLHICADMGNLQFAEYILNSSQPVELSPNNVGDTAKVIAIRHGFREIVQLIPHPFRKKKSKRRNRNSDSPQDQDSQDCSQISPPEPYKNNRSRSQDSPHSSTISPEHARIVVSHDEVNRARVLQHPSEEMPTATSSSMLSLWVPTTDSGISLPMDSKAEPIPGGSAMLRRKQKKNILEKQKPVDDLKYKHPKKEKVFVHEYEELREDPRFMSTTGSPKRTPKPTRRVDKQQVTLADFETWRYPRTFSSGAISDESVQYKGCFFRSKQKKLHASMRGHRKHSATDIEKELLMQKQAELRYELNVSKISLEKQMRKMTKKFEKALLATDSRFSEQKRREEGFHNQLRTELEIIEKSLERGSKRNVEEFATQIKSELSNLTAKLTRGLDLNPSSSVEDIRTRKNHRNSAVDLNRNISVSLSNINYNHTKHSNSGRSKPKSDASPTKRGSRNSDKNNNSEESIRQMYEKRLNDLEKEIRQNAKKEKENEELRARVRELEMIVKSEKTKTSVT